MIRRLRRKFIIVAMCSMLAVLAVIICVLNVSSYRSMVTRADRILQMLADNEGHFPEELHENMRDKNAKYDKTIKPDKTPGKISDTQIFPRELLPREDSFISAETPYDTRYFSVKLDADGQIVSTDTGRITAVKTEDAIEYAGLVLEKGKHRGFMENYRYLVAEGDETCARIIFVDCGKEIDSARKLLLTSAGMSGLGALAVFLLVLFFSRRVFKPVEESYVKQKQFITDASHELKTPLTIISANVDLLEMEGEESQWTQSIRNQVSRLRHLTEQMVTLSRLEEEEKPVVEKCDFSGIVKEIAENFEAPVLAKGKKLSMDITPGLTCMAEKEKLGQMVSLLLDNALKYATENGEIRVTLAPSKKNGKSKLTVWNTVSEDSGIAAGNQDVLFERFYRADSSRNSGTGGSGIGLSVVKAIVERYSGKITARSEDGKSIAFQIVL